MATYAAKLYQADGQLTAELDDNGNLKVYNQGAPYVGAGLQAAKATVVLADFTDGAGTSGTVTTDVVIPKGAVAVRTLIDNITGFIGDTTAVITVGDGTDADRYNTGTPSVFTTADTVDAGAASGTVYHSAEKSVVLTVTGGADFTSITAGKVTVTVLYYQSEVH